MVIGSYRDDEVGPDHPLRPVLGQLIPFPTTDRLVVPPLTIAAISTLASGSDVDPHALMSTTDGNAFFVTEVLAAGYMVPESVQEAVLSRVARLDDNPRASWKRSSSLRDRSTSNMPWLSWAPTSRTWTRPYLPACSSETGAPFVFDTTWHARPSRSRCLQRDVSTSI